MEDLKQFMVRHFERILVGIVLSAAFLGTYFVEEKSVVMEPHGQSPWSLHENTLLRPWTPK
jgi:hypothetical protein